MFEHSVPGLPEAAAQEQLTPLQYMRKYGVFKVSDVSYSRAHERALTAEERAAGTPHVMVDGVARAGFQHALAPARVLLTDARRVGLARARRPSLRSRATSTGAT